jgi:hypothetical protein
VSQSQVIRQAIDRLDIKMAPALSPDIAAWDEAKAFIEGLESRGPAKDSAQDTVDRGRTWTRNDLSTGFPERGAFHP